MKKYKPIVILLLACIGGQLSAQYPRWDCRSLPDSMEATFRAVGGCYPVKICLHAIEENANIFRKPPFDKPSDSGIFYGICDRELQYVRILPMDGKPHPYESHKAIIEDFRLHRKQLYLIVRYCTKLPDLQGPGCDQDAYVLIQIRNYRGRTTLNSLGEKVRALRHSESPFPLPETKGRVLLSRQLLLDRISKIPAHSELTEQLIKDFEINRGLKKTITFSFGPDRTDRALHTIPGYKTSRVSYRLCRDKIEIMEQYETSSVPYIED